VGGIGDYGFAMRGENLLYGQPLQSLAEPRADSIRVQPDEPLRWTEGKAALASKQNVARHESRVRGEPKEHLVGAPGIKASLSLLRVRLYC
jgi:hypothetical protein